MTLYQHAGVAIAFSPRMNALLAETAVRASALAAQLSLIHVGTHTAEKEAFLREALHTHGLPPDTPIHWGEGAPDTVILKTIEAQGIDLLLAGALEREKPIRYYLGSVAHNLVRDAPCSLILFTEPRIDPVPLRRIVVVADYSELALIALGKAIRLAVQEGADQIDVVRALPEYGEAMFQAEGMRHERARAHRTTTLEEEQTLLQDLIDAAGHHEVPIEPHCIQGHGGRAVADFVRQHQADLLVMPSRAGFGHFFERLFPSDMEWILREIPCNLWVVRERLRASG